MLLKAASALPVSMLEMQNLILDLLNENLHLRKPPSDLYALGLRSTVLAHGKHACEQTDATINI